MSDLRKQDVVPSSESYRFIPLTKGKFAVVDAADFALLNSFRWYTSVGKNTCYAYRRVNKRPIPMHSFILNLPLKRSRQIDHWNGDGLDNRRRNLRIASSVQNCRNRGISKSNSSGFKGVRFCTRARKWKATIVVSSHPIHIGYFDSLESAVFARQKAEKRIFGVYTRENAPSLVPRPGIISTSRPTSRTSSGKRNIQLLSDRWFRNGKAQVRHTGKLFRVSRKILGHDYAIGDFATIESAIEARNSFLLIHGLSIPD